MINLGRERRWANRAGAVERAKAALARRGKPQLTKRQREFLAFAANIPAEWAGVIPTGPSQHRMVGRLVDAGLLEYVSHGRNGTRENDTGVEEPIYALTDAGRRALAEQGGGTK